MQSKSSIKTILAVLLILAVAATIVIQLGSGSLFKGQIVKDGEVDQAKLAEEQAQGLLPDLQADIAVISPDAGSTDLTVNATITNVGTGTVLGNTPFKYAIYINDKEVFTNTDSYTSMDPGNSFSFKYPISKAIYQYGATGKVKFVVDTENALKEAGKDNNTKEIEYKL